MIKEDQFTVISQKSGFIAALDQSGGSTPKVLRLYGIEENEYHSDEDMFALIHGMRERIVKAPAFTGERIIGAILFENTLRSTFDGKPVADYLWQDRGVVPFLKVDKGLADEQDGVKLMKPITDLDEILTLASEKGVFGTKMRSVIESASPSGIRQIVDQQFEIGAQISARRLVPILEPEVNIASPDKAACEEILVSCILENLDALKAADAPAIMLKLSLPTEPNKYRPLVDHEKTVRVVALSGGYSRREANEKLALNSGVIASFSRGLTEGLHARQSDDDFNQTLEETIETIYTASRT